MQYLNGCLPINSNSNCLQKLKKSIDIIEHLSDFGFIEKTLRSIGM